MSLWALLVWPSPDCINVPLFVIVCRLLGQRQSMPQKGRSPSESREQAALHCKDWQRDFGGANANHTPKKGLKGGEPRGGGGSKSKLDDDQQGARPLGKLAIGKSREPRFARDHVQEHNFIYVSIGAWPSGISNCSGTAVPFSGFMCEPLVHPQPSLPIASFQAKRGFLNQWGWMELGGCGMMEC